MCVYMLCSVFLIGIWTLLFKCFSVEIILINRDVNFNSSCWIGKDALKVQLWLLVGGKTLSIPSKDCRRYYKQFNEFAIFMPHSCIHDYAFSDFAIPLERNAFALGDN